MAMKCMPSATSDLPDPVGVPKITWSPTMMDISASSWWGHKSIPRDSTQPMNAS